MGVQRATGLPWARFRTATGTACTSGTATKLSWDTLSGNGGGWAAPSVPLTSIVCPFAGIILVILDDIDWADSGNGAGYRHIHLRHNDVVGSQRAFSNAAPTLAASSFATAQNGPKVEAVAANETLEVYARQNSGSTLTPTVNGFHLQYLFLGAATFS